LNYEKKFLISSFLVIFSILFVFILYINYNSYNLQVGFLNNKTKKELIICSYKMNCPKTDINFIPKNKKPKPEILKLQEDKNSFFMVFDVPYLKKYYLKLSISKTEYLNALKKIKENIFRQFIVELAFILIFSLILTYILYKPLKEAYKINETFIKDILHDLNTPLTSLKLNIYLLKKEIGENQRIKKLEQNIKAILNYQENLKNFLSNNPNQVETFNIKDLIDEKLSFYSINYPHIKHTNSADCEITINKNAFNSVIENIISNAFKYNKKGGEIKIYMKDKKLIIEDTGIGIKNPQKVFNRFYKENERGIGIGMNIVKKLCDELKIDIKIESEKNRGTKVILDLSRYC